MRVAPLCAVLLLSCTSQVGSFANEVQERAEGEGADDDARDRADGSVDMQRPDAARADDGRDEELASEDGDDEARDPGRPRADAGSLTPGAGASSDCADEARWIYAIASTGALLRYEPDANTLTEVGTIDCPTSSTPFSMAVSRDAIAYVLHADGEIYAVATSDASCTATGYVPGRMGFEAFGMGFVSNDAGSEQETLFIAGGSAAGLSSSRLGALDTSSWGLTAFGELDGAAELTGNGDGELWAFIADGAPLVVRELDKNTGGTLREIDVSSIDRIAAASAWAFAFWGGRYYIFYQGSDDASTSIYRLTPDSERVERVHADSGYRIVGAGVSTCAPTTILL